MLAKSESLFMIKKSLAGHFDHQLKWKEIRVIDELTDNHDEITRFNELSIVFFYEVVEVNPHHGKTSWRSPNYIVEKINAFNPTPQSALFVLGFTDCGHAIGDIKELMNCIVQEKSASNTWRSIWMNMLVFHRIIQKVIVLFCMKTLIILDIEDENINLLNGTLEDPQAECERYEAKIKSCGKINLLYGRCR